MLLLIQRLLTGIQDGFICGITMKKIVIKSEYIKNKSRFAGY